MKKRITTYDVKLVKEECKTYELATDKLNSSSAAGEVVQTVLHLNDSTVEKFGIICLNTQLQVIGIHIISIGSISECQVDLRGIFQRALLNNSSKIILFHNHPSGDPKPSDGDIQITKRIADAGEIMQIEILDHIIVGDPGRYYSLQERGRM